MRCCILTASRMKAFSNQTSSDLWLTSLIMQNVEQVYGTTMQRAVSSVLLVVL